MRSEAGSQVVRYRGGGTGPADYPVRRGEAEEEWVTKKKVEITTTKNVERKIQRQLVLEDGRVVEEEVPTVTVDTSEDKQTFETDHDEDRRVEGGGSMNMVQSQFSNSRGGLLVGDKFTSIKKVQDVKENLVKTEAVQSLGDIATRDVEKVIRDKEDIRKYLRRGEGDNNTTAVVLPRTVYTKRNHRIITDKEDIQERNWLNEGQMQNERIKTEEHIEYDSDDTPESGSSSSMSASSKHVLEPEIYKTRKDEKFTEYFQVGHNNGKEYRTKIGDGPHLVSESKEVQREEDRRLADHLSSPRLTHLSSSRSKNPVTHTDSWLERHFGSSSSSLSASSVDLSRTGGGPGGLRRSASICDIRPVTESSSNVYYATVRKTGKVPPVVRRERKDDYYIQNRQSANFSSSGHPIRPPRKKKTDSDSSNGTTTYATTTEIIYGTAKPRPEYVYGTLKRDGPNGSFVFEREDTTGSASAVPSATPVPAAASGNSLRREVLRGGREDRPSSRTRRSEHKENIGNGSVSRREPPVVGRSQTPTERPLNSRGAPPHSKHLPEKYLFGNPVSSLTNNTRLKGHNSSNTSHYHSSSNIRSYSPLPQKLTRSSKSHHQSTGNLQGHADKERRENAKNRFGSSTDLTFHREKYYRSEEPPISPVVRESNYKPTSAVRESNFQPTAPARETAVRESHYHQSSVRKSEPMSRSLPRPPPEAAPPPTAADSMKPLRSREIPIMTEEWENGGGRARPHAPVPRDIPVQPPIKQTRDIYKDSFPSSQQAYSSTRRELYSSRDNIYSTASKGYDSSKRESTSGKDKFSSSGKDIYSSIGKDVYSGAGKDIYSRTGRDTYSSGPKDIYSGGPKDIYSSGHKDIYSSGPKDIYSSPNHRIVYTTESPVGSPSTKYRTRIVLNGGLA